MVSSDASGNRLRNPDHAVEHLSGYGDFALLGLPVSLGRVHDVLQAATRWASAINRDQDLSGIRVGLHDEIFQGATPVLAGVDARSTCTLQGVWSA